MFEGSQHHDHGYFQPLQGAGASLNGSTNADRTNYWEVVPTDALELALWMESDRMGYLLPALTEAKFANQRDVVLNERRQNYENRPYGLAPMAMLAALFPPDHPYHWTTIGEIADLQAARLDEVRAFFRALLPSGERVARARRRHRSRRRRSRWSSAYFGEIDAGARGRAGARRRASLDGDVAHPARGSRRAAAALPRVALAGDVRRRRRRARSGGRPARQRQDVAPVPPARVRRAHRDRRLGVAELARDRRASSRSPRPRRPATRWPSSSASILEEIARLAADGPTDDEIERGRVQAEAQFVFRLQTVGGFGGKSDQLNAYNVFLGDPGVLRPRPRALPAR